jgi:hypothetical protein
MPPNPPPPWWSRATELKDTLSLTELAATLGVPVTVVAREFRDRGVSKRILATPARSVHPGTRGAARPPAAPDLGGAVRSGSKDLQLEAHHARLGTVPDAEIARLAGVSVRTVASYRSRHGIPGYDGPRRTPPIREGGGSRVDDFHALLGVVPDRVVAELAGMSLGAIRNFRIKAGIDAAGRLTDDEIAGVLRTWRGGATPTPVAAPPPVPTARSAWRITGPGDALVVVAPSLAAALRAAADALGGDGAIRTVEALGAVLHPA